MSSFLIYDNHCPMCKVYTKAFVKMEFLGTDGRVAFSEIEDEKVIAMIDWKRAKNEIPFADIKENKTYYGVDALLKILGEKWKFFKWYSKQNILVWLAKKLYKFVSFNRRVIVAAKEVPCKFDAKPDFNLTYRILYLLFAWLVSSLVLSVFSSDITTYVNKGIFGREFLISGGQIVFQTALLLLFTRQKEKLFDYLGNLMTVSLAGSLLLIPCIVIGDLFENSLFSILYFMLIASWMFFDHWRRTKLLGLPIVICLSWAAYRFLVLYFVLQQ